MEPRSRLVTKAGLAAGFFLLLMPMAGAQLNWEGQTGGLITPYAYTSPSARGIGRPQLAFHYLDGGPVVGADFQASITVGFLRIGEGGYTRTFNAEGSSVAGRLFANGFNAGHIKFRFLPENAFKTSFVPAVAAGSIVRTQVRRLTEVTERENTTATDFYVVGTKTIHASSSFSVLLNLGGKLTNASMLGIAANSPGWELKSFGGAWFLLDAPRHSKLTLGAEFARQPRQLKEVPGAVVPTTLAYLARWHGGETVPVTIDFGIMQLGGSLSPSFDIEARSQVVAGVAYRF